MKKYLLKITILTVVVSIFSFRIYEKNNVNTKPPKEIFQRWKLNYGMANGVKIQGLPQSPNNDYEFKKNGKYFLYNEDETYMIGTWEYNKLEKIIYTKRSNGEINGKFTNIKLSSITLIPAGKAVKGTPFENFRFYYVPKTTKN